MSDTEIRAAAGGGTVALSADPLSQIRGALPAPRPLGAQPRATPGVADPVPARESRAIAAPAAVPQQPAQPRPAPAGDHPANRSTQAAPAAAAARPTPTPEAPTSTRCT